jgi:hypothetical protein
MKFPLPYNSGKSLTRQGKLASREGRDYEGRLNEESACSEVSFLTSTKCYWRDQMNKGQLDFVLISWFPSSPTERVSVTPANDGNRFRLINVLLFFGIPGISVDLR